MLSSGPCALTEGRPPPVSTASAGSWKTRRPAPIRVGGGGLRRRGRGTLHRDRQLPGVKGDPALDLRSPTGRKGEARLGEVDLDAFGADRDRRRLR